VWPTLGSRTAKDQIRDFIHSYQILNNNKDYQVLMRGPNMPARNSTPPFWKNGYISNRRTDFDEVWHGVLPKNVHFLFFK